MEQEWARFYPYILAILISLALALGAEPGEEGSSPYEECLASSTQNTSFGPYGDVEWGEDGSPAPPINAQALCALNALSSAQPPASYSSPQAPLLNISGWECPLGNDSAVCRALDSMLGSAS